MRHVSDISDVSIISDISDVSGGRLVETVAAFIRARRGADRGELLLEILDHWPQISADALDLAINFRPSGRRLLVLPRQPASF